MLGTETCASTIVESIISKIGAPGLMTVPESRNRFWIYPSNGARIKVCSNLTQYKSTCAFAMRNSELARSISWLEINPFNFKSLNLFKACSARSNLA